jgi:dTMP kinase
MRELGNLPIYSMLLIILRRCKIECIVTREPGGTAFGESVRDILLDANSNLDSVSEAVLFYASRVYNYNNVILKALSEGKYVICDRFHYSTLVYQGAFLKSNKEVIELHNVLDGYFAKNISLIFHLDASIDTSFSRIKERDVSDKFEKQGKEFLIKIKEAYSEVFKNNTKAVNISTDGDKNDVEKLIKKYLDRLINE